MRTGWIGIVLVWLAAVTAVSAQTARGDYVIEYGIFGKMGTAQAIIERNATRYRIEMTARATGLAKVLSGGRVERYSSEGRIQKGRLVPDRYSKDVAYSGKRRVKHYRFDHKARKVSVHEITYRGDSVKERNDTLPYYADNDIFSLYFNIGRIIGDCAKPFDQDLYAVGAEKKTGRVHVKTIVGERERMLATELLGKGACYLQVTVYQKLFGSKGGVLYLALRDDGIAMSAVLKDVVMFGDIRGRMVEYKESD